jgi:hypothetical protein
MKNQSQSRIAVVTGAGGTLCSEIAKALAEQNFCVALLGRSIEGLREVEQFILARGGCAMALATDVTDLAAVQAANEQILSTWGTPSVLINGAGGNQMGAITTVDEFDKRELHAFPQDFSGFLNMDMNCFQNVLNINTLGTVIPCQVFGSTMAANGGGSIINFSSMNGYRPLSRVPAYAMAKAAVNNFTQWLAAYLAPAGVRVNAIAPGFFLNDKNRSRLLNDDGDFTERGTRIIRQTPMHRFGGANELVGCINWLIDETQSGFVTGVVIPIDGGFLSSAGI